MVDLRVVVIAGRPTHVVVRGRPRPDDQPAPGRARGDLAALRAAAGRVAYGRGDGHLRRGWPRAFPGSLHVGVDLMFAPGWRRHAVAEVNAFGDLLPGLLVDGRDTYADQVDALLRRGRGGADGRR